MNAELSVLTCVYCNLRSLVYFIWKYAQLWLVNVRWVCLGSWWQSLVRLSLLVCLFLSYFVFSVFTVVAPTPWTAPHLLKNQNLRLLGTWAQPSLNQYKDHKAVSPTWNPIRKAKTQAASGSGQEIFFYFQWIIWASRARRSLFLSLIQKDTP